MPVSQKNSHGCTPLRVAPWRGTSRTDRVRKLLDAGSVVAVKCPEDGTTTLQSCCSIFGAELLFGLWIGAASSGDAAVVKMLRDAGADAKNYYGKTSLDIAWAGGPRNTDHSEVRSPSEFSRTALPC